MDPTNRRRHPKSSYSSSAAVHTTTTTTTSYDVRNHFSNLTTTTSTSNRKALSRSLNPDVMGINLQAEALTKSAMLPNYSKTAPLLSQSKSLKEGRIGVGTVNKGKVGYKEVERDRRTAMVVRKEVAKPKRGESIDYVDAKVKKEHPKFTGEQKPAVKLAVATGGGGGGGGLRRRGSFNNVEVELADILVKNGVKVISADMSPVMQIHAVGLARKTRDSLEEKFTSRTLALALKKEFDGMYGPAWHCIVGTSFGSFVTHSVGGFMYFSMDHKHYILLFKTTVQRA